MALARMDKLVKKLMSNPGIVTDNSKINVIISIDTQVMSTDYQSYINYDSLLLKIRNMLLSLFVKGDNSLIFLITLKILKWESTNEIEFFVNIMIQQQRECYIRNTCILFEDLSRSVLDFMVANVVLLVNSYKNY